MQKGTDSVYVLCKKNAPRAFFAAKTVPLNTKGHHFRATFSAFLKAALIRGRSLIITRGGSLISGKVSVQILRPPLSEGC